MRNYRALRSYVRKIIREMTREDVETSGDPLDWLTAAYQEPEEWGTKNPFDAMKIAAQEFGLKLLGEGSSRIVFKLNQKQVVKVALNKKGLAQNELEMFAGRDPHIEQLLAGVWDAADDFSWVVSDLVKPLDEDEFTTAEKVIGVSWNDVREIIGLKRDPDIDMSSTNPGNHGIDIGDGWTADTPPVASGKTGVISAGNPNCLRGQEFLDYLEGFMMRYQGMLKGDLARLDSWGITPGGCLVLLDYGITKKNFDILYKTEKF